MNSKSEPEWPRIRDLPTAEQHSFRNWLIGQTAPSLENVPRAEQDGYYPWDYARWKQGLPAVD